VAGLNSTPAKGIEHSEDNVREMLLLAERLRESHGSLDDTVIQAVSEATGAPTEFVRLAMRMLPEKRKSIWQQMSGAVLSLEPEVRRHVISGFVGTICGLLSSATHRTGQELFQTLMLIGIGIGLWNVSVSRDSRTAATSGAIFGGVFFVATSLFEFLFKTGRDLPSPILILAVAGGAIGGLVLQRIVSRNRKRLGMGDPVQERQELLRQLVDLQDRLRSGEQHMTFLCVDIVGSTKLKASADPLAVEFTFTEYHQFVDMIARRYGGRVHSTAGDGVTCAFEHPQQAFGAARTIQSGLVELNTFRNKIGVPLQLRIAVHAGEVVAPDATDITSVNFAHVIDIASHLQRVCPPGGIVVSDAAVTHLPGGPASVGTEKVTAMDTSGYVWRPRSAVSQSLSEVPPPPPMAPEGV